MKKQKGCTNPDPDPKTGKVCQGIMTYDKHVRHPGPGAVGRDLGQPLNLPAAQYGPGWKCGTCGYVEPDHS